MQYANLLVSFAMFYNMFGDLNRCKQLLELAMEKFEPINEFNANRAIWAV